MNIEIVDSYNALSYKAKEIIVREIKKNENLLFCAATGGSPTGTYDLLCKEYPEQPELFSQLRIIKLDEWGGIPMNHYGTCETYLQTHLIQPLHITGNRYISFQSNPEYPVEECNHIQNELDREAPVDLCILGLGMNGHLALNEPESFLQPYCHIAELSETSIHHPMISDAEQKPSYGLTLGMANIFQSKTILMLITGSKKRSITKQFLSKKITTGIPASLLWMHPNTICLIDKNAAG